MNTENTKFWDPHLKGIGQIMLQANTLTGLLFLLGILINSPMMALATLVATVAGTLTAVVLKYNKEHIENGLYGFNAALVGVAMVVFFQPSVAIWITIVVFSALSSIIINFALTKNIPVFTFPFIALTWIALFLFHNVLPGGVPPVQESITDIAEIPFSLLNHGIGFGEVIFQSSLLSGIIFFIAVYISNPTAAIYGIFGAVFGVVVAVLVKGRVDEVMTGMFSFNAVLCAIVFSGTKKRDGLFVVIAILISGLTEELFLRLGLYALTFPFVFATWMTLLIRNAICKKEAIAEA